MESSKDLSPSVVSLENYNSTSQLTDKKKDSNYDPFEHRKIEHPNSDFEGFVHLLKCSLGTGILAMPHAMRNAGIVVGVILTPIIGLVCTHCVHILVNSSHILCKRENIPLLTYAATAETAFRTGPKQLHKFSRVSRSAVDFLMSFTYFCSLCVYLVFISTSLKQVVDHYYADSWNIRIYILMVAPFLILLGLIRNLKYLVPTSTLANIFIISGLGITLYYVFKDNISMEGKDYVAAAIDFPIFFSTAIFAMEGIGVVMPVENTMKNPRHFLGCPGILNVAMIIIVVLYTVIGFFGYMKYGDETEASITLNLPKDEVLAQVVKILVAVAIMFSYALQVFIPVSIWWPHIKYRLPEKIRSPGQSVFRILVVLGTVGIAEAIPNLGPIISLVGAICYSTLGLLYPAIIETATKWENQLGKFKWILWKNILIIIFSLAALISGTYNSILEIIDEYAAEEE